MVPLRYCLAAFVALSPRASVMTLSLASSVREHYCAQQFQSRALKEYLSLTLLAWVPRPLGVKARQVIYRSLLGKTGKSIRIFRGVELVGTRSIYLGSNVILKQQVQIAANSPESSVALDDGVILDRGVDIRVVPGYAGCSIAIGKDSYLGPYCCLAGPGSITIGQNCMIASHSGIYANNHIFDDPQCPIAHQGIIRKGVVIGDDCWLGTGVKVLDGVTIGQGCVVGAGAVVTKDLPPYSVAVGVPARLVAKRGESIGKTGQ